MPNYFVILAALGGRRRGHNFTALNRSNIDHETYTNYNGKYLQKYAKNKGKIIKLKENKHNLPSREVVVTVMA